MTGALNPNPEPSDITPEMRRAVDLERCEIKGHEFTYDKAVTLSDTPNVYNGGWPNYEIESGEDGRLPYIRCISCRTVWLVIDEPGKDYDDAIRKLKKRFGNPEPDSLKPKPRRERRREQQEMLIDERRKNRRRMKANVDEHGVLTTELIEDQNGQTSETSPKKKRG